MFFFGGTIPVEMSALRTAFSFHGDEDGGGVCHALVLALARSGDAVDEQADEARLPHLARKRVQRGGVGGGSTSSSAS
jgi:hypothetical protein